MAAEHHQNNSVWFRTCKLHCRSSSINGKIVGASAVQVSWLTPVVRWYLIWKASALSVRNPSLSLFHSHSSSDNKILQTILVAGRVWNAGQCSSKLKSAVQNSKVLGQTGHVCVLCDIELEKAVSSVNIGHHLTPELPFTINTLSILPPMTVQIRTKKGGSFAFVSFTIAARLVVLAFPVSWEV